MSAGPGAAVNTGFHRPPLCDIILDKGIVRRSLIIAAIVGTILNFIAQGDFLFDGMALNYWKICLTYCVPYIVATYGACTARLETYRKQAAGGESAE